MTSLRIDVELKCDIPDAMTEIAPVNSYRLKFQLSEQKHCLQNRTKHATAFNITNTRTSVFMFLQRRNSSR